MSPSPESPAPENPGRSAGRPSASTRARRARGLGQLGEDAAAAWYEAAGFEVLERNWRCRQGELDLVAAKDDVTVFCEVKTRSSDAFGSPAEAVTGTKRMRLRRLAAAWLQSERTGFQGSRRARTGTVRFDVASVIVERGGVLRVEVIEGAF